MSASTHVLLLPETDEAQERPTRALESLLSSRFAPEDIPALETAAGGLDFFAMLRELFRLGEADFVVRMAVLAEIAESDRAAWEPDALLRHFVWLAPEALSHVLRALRRSGWLELDVRDHRLTERGEALFPIIRRVLDVRADQGDLALGVLNVQLSRDLGTEATPALRHLRHNLCRIAGEAESALESHSEVRILETRERIDRNLAWARRARVAIEEIDLSETEAYRVAQQVGQQLSELHRWHAALYRALGDLADKRVALGESGLSIVDMTQFLMRCDVDVLAEFGESLVAMPLAPIFGIVDNLLIEAEYELVHAPEREEGPSLYGWTDGAPEDAPPGEPELPEFTALDRFVADMGALGEGGGALRLSEIVPGRTWAESAYRLSLLALSETDPDREIDPEQEVGGDPALAALVKAVPFGVEVDAPGRAFDAIDAPFRGEVTRGWVVRHGASVPTAEADVG